MVFVSGFDTGTPNPEAYKLMMLYAILCLSRFSILQEMVVNFAATILSHIHRYA